MRHPKEYDVKVKGQCLFVGRVGKQWLSGITEYVQRFATKEAADAAVDGQDEDEDEEMSDIGSISDAEWYADHILSDYSLCIYKFSTHIPYWRSCIVHSNSYILFLCFLQDTTIQILMKGRCSDFV